MSEKQIDTHLQSIKLKIETNHFQALFSIYCDINIKKKEIDNFQDLQHTLKCIIITYYRIIPKSQLRQLRRFYRPGGGRGDLLRCA